MNPLNITFCGNFSQPHCTENDLSWSFEKLGHKVHKIQENGCFAADILHHGLKSDLVMLVHTHGPTWEPQGDMFQVLDELKNNGIPTASHHLDLFRGLLREVEVNEHWAWKVQYYFGVDGRSHKDGWYRERGVNHYLIRPGVCERDCWMALKYEGERVPVMFVGSYGYHHEYPMRPRLIDWLKETYGSQFAKFGNPEQTVRGDALNLLYASSAVVVGDSCHLEGNHDYWSDRAYECMGRGGFMLHPWIPGMETEFTDRETIAFYKHGDFTDLKEKIDYYLAHDDERETIRRAGHELVKTKYTYTQRMEYLLHTIFPQTEMLW